MPSFYSPCRVLVCILALSAISLHTTAQDTLTRSKLSFLISDSAHLSWARMLPADTFSNVQYSRWPGITTFRGNPYRNTASIGTISKRPDSLVVRWSRKTAPAGEWGGGAGWTGQPVVVQWPDSIVRLMNVKPSFKDSALSEIIVGSLDGHIYFLELTTGKPTRSPIDIHNPIKGSVAVDPRGWPILYAGQGIALKKEFGFRMFSLLDQSQLFFLNGHDDFAMRRWGAFDGSPLINAKQDAMYLGGENGVVYVAKLNTTLDSLRRINLSPKVFKMRYRAKADQQLGIENSVAAYQDKLFFADNEGYIMALDLKSMSVLWAIHNHDDTDASLVVEPENGIPYLYTGNEVDKQGKKGYSFLKKINGLTGATVWEKKYSCLTVLGDHPVNGGLLATPVLGKQNARDLVIFNLSRYGTMSKGLLVALRKSTGEMVYEIPLPHYAWSSPVDIYDAAGNMYIFLADSRGYVSLYDGSTGNLIHRKKVADLFEASPVVINNLIVIPSRPDRIFCLELR